MKTKNKIEQILTDCGVERNRHWTALVARLEDLEDCEKQLKKDLGIPVDTILETKNKEINYVDARTPKERKEDEKIKSTTTSTKSKKDIWWEFTEKFEKELAKFDWNFEVDKDGEGIIFGKKRQDRIVSLFNDLLRKALFQHKKQMIKEMLELL